jgi:hypothetical protein
VIVTGVEADTANVVTVKVALVPPAGTVTDVGALAACTLLLVSPTTAPPVGAGSASVTVPVELVPPVTVVGLKLNELRAGGVTVNTAVCVAPL